MRQITRGLVWFVLLLSLVSPAVAVTSTATIRGTVTDPAGAVVAGAKVTVVNTATSFVTATETAADGGYYVPYLTPGDYRMTVNAAGFKESVREGLTLIR